MTGQPTAPAVEAGRILVDGMTTGRWFNAAGCRRRLTVPRDPSSDTVLEVVT